MNPFPPVIPSVGWRSAGVDLLRRADDLAARACYLLALSVDECGADPAAVLRTIESACLLALRHRDDAAAVVALLRDVERLADEVSERAMIGLARRLAECERGLARLREITTTAGLIDGVCDELIRSLGFDRTMLARVEGGMWRPWKANASMLDEPWVDEWIEKAIPLDELTLETRLLTERRPALILDTQVDGIAQIVHAAGVRSYVAAPIMPGGQVVGFFHADHGACGRTCDEVDRDILWTFAESFGHLYERTALLEQLHARTDEVRRTFSGLTDALEQLTDSELTLVQGDQDLGTALPSLIRQPIGIRLGRFTARELEVLELVVAGARNSEIAQRLAITEATVKTHVKNLLAKLGVRNRSQAIAAYLGALEQSPPSR